MNVKETFNQSMKEFKENFPLEKFKDKEFYAQWLAQTYFFVKHSTPLLGYALPYLQNEGLQRHFEHHLGEESRHDLMAVKDIEKLGYKVSDFKEYPVTQAFYQSQYYRIAFQGGTSLLGYILFLEGVAVHVGREAHAVIKDVHKGATVFLKVHAEEDPEHVGQALQAIQSLSDKEQLAIMQNFRYSQDIYMKMMEEAVKCSVPVKKAA